MKICLEKFPIRQIGIEDKNYPELLKKIDTGPKTIYYRGELDSGKNCFAVVGTRMASDYGKEAAFSFAKELSKAGLCIVSGMALGVDSWAHKGALTAGGKTIAVLGTGLDESSIYPQENLRLAKEILEKGGGILSEYPVGSSGFRGNFLQRNRLISGLSLGVLVVEAKIKSGALNTAAWAKKQGKKVFALPGPFQSLNSQGCHLLIKQGAQLAASADDILKGLGRGHKKTNNLKRITNNTPEGLVLGVLRSGCLGIDKIIEKTGLPAQVVSSCLSLLEIEEKVKNLGANTFALSPI